jgi:cell division protein ZapA (FtsZ GTPase activity inhibitor)
VTVLTALLLMHDLFCTDNAIYYFKKVFDDSRPKMDNLEEE